MKENHTTQSVMFPKSLFTTAQARSWMKTNGLRAIKRVDSTEEFYRYRIAEPNDKKRYKTVVLNNGVRKVIMY